MTQADSPSCPTKMYSTSPGDRHFHHSENVDDHGGGGESIIGDVNYDDGQIIIVMQMMMTS